jgi:hypothetical protein
MPHIITDERALRTPAQAIRERLGQLTSDQLEAGLVFLSGYDPALFELVVHAGRHGTTGAAPARLISPSCPSQDQPTAPRHLQRPPGRLFAQNSNDR